MDRFDREILDYVRSWSPYGGPPADEVLAEFGLTPGQLTERVNHIIAVENASHVEELAQPWQRVKASRERARMIGT
ncbi:DUF3263 domain-containing protein [Mycolicibacterium sp. P9-22]|uniref:DUF3263 domain-containing protein n=1 Tax=Mycolicibacterium sp. P9-22 TaxID=2024613 RepID=UPI0011EE306E|nr:DUF3263 domain-containing protein [Mycolicibacterium sp. P9-22]KAA0117935.1 DUF3263 domain-containing protein [Mycolicibacterium sp. P9-22]